MSSDQYWERWNNNSKDSNSSILKDQIDTSKSYSNIPGIVMSNSKDKLDIPLSNCKINVKKFSLENSDADRKMSNRLNVSNQSDKLDQQDNDRKQKDRFDHINKSIVKLIKIVEEQESKIKEISNSDFIFKKCKEFTIAHVNDNQYYYENKIKMLDNNFSNLKDAVNQNTKIIKDYESLKESRIETHKELGNYVQKSELNELKKEINIDFKKLTEDLNKIQEIDCIKDSNNKFKLNIENKLENFQKITENQQNLINSISFNNDNIRPKLNNIELEINNLTSQLKKCEENMKQNSKNITIEELSDINSSYNNKDINNIKYKDIKENKELNQPKTQSPFISFRTQTEDNNQILISSDQIEKLKIIENRISNFENRFNSKIDSMKKYMEGTTSCLKDHDIKIANNTSELTKIESNFNSLSTNIENYKQEQTPQHQDQNMRDELFKLCDNQIVDKIEFKTVDLVKYINAQKDNIHNLSCEVEKKEQIKHVKQSHHQNKISNISNTNLNNLSYKKDSYEIKEYDNQSKIKGNNSLKKSNSITRFKGSNISPYLSSKDQSAKTKEGLSKKYENKLLSPAKTSTNFIKGNINDLKDITPSRNKNSKVKNLTSGNINIKRNESINKLSISRNNSKKSLFEEKQELINNKSNSILLETKDKQDFEQESQSRINLLEDLHRDFLN